MVMSREQRRRLTDLYVTGRTLTLDDGSTEKDPESGEEVAFEPITVYLRKLNPIDQETCLRRANAERSKVLSLRNHPESPEYETYEQEVEGMSDEERILLLSAEDINKFRAAREAEVAADDEWAKERYLDGLLDAWQNGLSAKYAVDPEDPEALRVFTEMQRYQKTVDDLVASEQELMTTEFQSLAPEDLRRRTVDRLIGFAADSAWLQEYRRSELWLSVRDPDNHKTRYFESREEVNDLSVEIVQRLVAEYNAMNVPTIEGKGSGATPTSSDSSEQPKQEEVVVASGLLA